MCSIIAYASCKDNDVSSVLLDALSLMEYRGYDSVGIAVLNGSSINVRKGIGNVREVSNKHRFDELVGRVGIGHTRWAAYGHVSNNNAHPHTSCNGKIAIVHNGIIDNYMELREMLKSHKFKSDTDSEVIAHLLEHLISKGYNLKDAMVNTLKLLNGSYAFVALLDGGTLLGSRNDEPLIIGVKCKNSKNTYSTLFISSDVLAFIKYTDNAIFLSNKEFFIIKQTKRGYNLSIYNENGSKIAKDITQIAWEFAGVDKGKYAHYTLKEIHEQEYTVAKALITKVSDEFLKLLTNARRVIVTGSGSSYHASLYAKYMLAKANVSIDSCIASELKYNSIDSSDLILAISQSGETADLLDAVKHAKSKGCKILSIVNVSTSSLARESDRFVSINAGPEIGVAATKSFTAQLALIYKIALVAYGSNNSKQQYSNNGDSNNNAYSILDSLSSIISNGIKDIIARDGISKIANKLRDVNDIIIIGKGINHIIALEGALKLKELAYIHAEAISAGELKHGPLALIDKSSIVIALNPKDYTYKDVINSIKEVKARGAYVIGVSDSYCNEYDAMLELPSVNSNSNYYDGAITETASLIYPIYECIPLQLLAYNIAVKKNINPDYPRNIAKSVTVT